jgi:AcrR family transcriptional regulator
LECGEHRRSGFPFWFSKGKEEKRRCSPHSKVTLVEGFSVDISGPFGLINRPNGLEVSAEKGFMRHPSSDIRTTRRQQIVDAAVAVITEQGIQNLSLSEIEKRAGMSRGQLTYYFKTKEGILLAIFDHLVQRMHQRVGTPGGAEPCAADVWDWVRHLLAKILAHPPLSPEFGCLQHTFLAEMGRREDFRRRLASLYEEWRGHMAAGLAEELARNPRVPAVPPRTLASLIQALFHGLSVQLVADPDAFDREEMLNLCLDLLGSYLRVPPRRRTASRPRLHTNGSSPRRKARSLPRSRGREP